MKEYPLIFTAESVRAILSGRKTQTRRVLKNPGFSDSAWFSGTTHPRGDGGIVFGTRPYLRVSYDDEKDMMGERVRVPGPVVGDRIWVKETWAVPGTVARSDDPVWQGMKVAYRAELDDGLSWRSPIYMPRWASRLTLEVTEIRIQRLQSITAQDAVQEGIIDTESGWDGNAYYPLARFKSAWDSINAKRGYPWDSNCWVVARTFRVVD